jgi:hypothetical protein
MDKYVNHIYQRGRGISDFYSLPTTKTTADVTSGKPIIASSPSQVLRHPQYDIILINLSLHSATVMQYN